MSDFSIRLRAYTPEGVKGRVIPTKQLEVTQVESSAATVSFTLSRKVAGQYQAPYVVGLEYGTGAAFVNPRNNLFIVTEDNSDNAEETKTAKFNGINYLAWLLARNVMYTHAAANNGHRKWVDTFAARPLLVMVEEAQARGWGPSFDVDWDYTEDSNGSAWTGGDDETQSFPLGISAWKVLAQASDQGLYEWWTEGMTLRVFRPGTGIDLHDTVEIGGKGYDRAPMKSTFEDAFTHLLIMGDELKAPVNVTNTGASTEFGRLEAVMTQSGVEKPTTAVKLAGPALRDGKGIKREYVFEWNPSPAMRRPWTHFNIGDLVSARGLSGWATQRVVGIQVSQDEGPATVRVTTGSKILTLNSKAIRKLGGASVGGQTGGSGLLVPAATPVPPTEPEIPTGLTVASNVGYFHEDGTARANVVLEWDEVTTATDGTVITIAEYEVRHKVTAAPGWRVTPAIDGQVEIDTWESGVERTVKVRARSEAGAWGDFSSNITVTPGLPSTVPEAPTAPVLSSKLSTVTATWDGDLTSGAPAAGWAHNYLEASDDAGGPWTVVGSLERGGLTFPASAVGAGVGDTVWARLTAVDTVGGESIKSASASITVLGIEGPDLEADTITANELAVGAVQAQHMAVGVGGSGQRVEITGSGLRVFDPDDNAVVSIGTSDDDVIAVMQKNAGGDPIPVASIDQNGDAVLQTLDLSSDLSLAGVSVMGTFGSDPMNGFDLSDIPLFDRNGRGMVAQALIGTPAYTGVSHTYAALAVGTVTLLAGRVYQVKLLGPTAQAWTTSPSSGDLFVQCYIGTGAQNVTTPDQTDGAASSCVVLRSNAGTDTGVQEAFNFRPFIPAVSGEYNILIRLYNASTRSWSFNPNLVSSNPVRVVVEDVRSALLPLEAESWESRVTSGGVTPPDSVKTAVFNATWSVLWGPSGSIRPSSGNLYDDGRLLQGGGSSIGGDRAAQVGFGALGLSSKTIKGMWVRLKNRHTGLSTGASVDFGTHGNSSAPSGSSPNSSNTWTRTVKKGQDLWVPIPSSLWAGFAAGTYRGIQIGGPNVNSGSSDYAIFDGYSTTNAASSSGVRPQLKVTYQ